MWQMKFSQKEHFEIFPDVPLMNKFTKLIHLNKVQGDHNSHFVILNTSDKLFSVICNRLYSHHGLYGIKV